MKQTSDYITEEKKKELLAELEYLNGKKRKEILEDLAYAKSLGDLKENAEYHQVREDQVKLEERIAKIGKILQDSQVVKGGGGDVVEVGSKVVVVKKGEETEKIFQIVGGEEADMSKGKISHKSPFGKALLGKKANDSISFKTPNGEVHYKVIRVY